ncbi:MAG: efflux RND transporter permease subunit, partial [Eubacterium sp.]|nr:efflux RND transporter permease subunit [Eubacterium sp.]
SKFSVKKPFTVLVAVVIILVLGFLSFQDMSMDLLPKMELPYAIVMTTYPGASPEEVERAVTDPIERAMSSVSNIKNVQSTSVNNMSIVMMEFNEGTDMGTTTVDMRETLDMTTAQWDDSIGSPTIMKMNPDMMPIMVTALDYKDAETTEVTKKVAQDIVPELESVEGVASVTTTGAVEKQVSVIIQQDKLDEMNKKVQDAIEGKFEESEKKIADGEKKMEDGSENLQSKSDSAAEQMAKGETKLNDASDKIKDGLKEIESQITQVKEQQKTLNTNAKSTKQGLATIAANIKKIEPTVKTLTTLKEQLEKTQSSLTALRSQESSLSKQIEVLGDAAPQELKTSLATVQAQIKVIEEGLSKQGMNETTLATKVKEVNTNLTSAQSGLTELQKQQKSLQEAQKKIQTAQKKINSGLKKLGDAKKKLEKGKISTSEAMQKLSKEKILAGIKLSVAQTKLDNGSEKMKEAKKTLKTTKKTTKENSDLNKIITKSMVENLLKAENFDMPSGYVTEDDASYLVRVGDKTEEVKDFSEMVICDMGIDGLDPIRLKDVADVAQTDNSEDVYTVVDGNPAVLVVMQKQSGYSTGDVTGALEYELAQLEKTNDGFHSTILMNQGIYIDLVVDSVVQNLIVGGILAIFILLFFLKDLRPTLIVACSIPLSVVSAIVAMYFSGVTLNIISLSGLALGVGMLVDNSVVVIENIYRLRSKGVPIQQAAVDGARQVGGAIIASTLTTVCVFAPIIFTDGITKQLFVDLALTLAYTLGASLIIALTLVPAMASGMLRKDNQRGESKIVRAIQNFYFKVIKVALKRKAIVLIASVVLLVAFSALAMTNGFSMMPEMESTQMTVTLTTEDKELEEIRQISNTAIERVKTIADVETVGAYAGNGSSMSMLTGSGGDDSVTMYLILKEKRELDNDEITQAITEKTKDLDCEVDVNASAMDMSSLTGSGAKIVIKGKDLDKLTAISEDLMKKLEGVEGIEEISNGLEDSGEEFRISVDKAKAMKYGLTVAQVYQKVYDKLKEASSATTLSTDTEDLGVYVTNAADKELQREDIQNMKIEYTDMTTQKTKNVKLSKIASFKTVASPNAVNHRGQSRYVSVTAKFKDGYIVSDVSDDVAKVAEAYEAPAGYDVELDGENEATTEAMGQVLLMMVLGVVLMYLIMVAQFQSLLSPFIILFTIPLAFTGGFLALWITGSDVSVIAMIGFVMLSGIIVNNGIVLVDYINQLRLEGMEKKEAIAQAGVTRLRPILMTALTTILGLVPMVVGNQMGADMTRPMAIVTIGGLIYGTLLTLFVVPCIYDVLNRKEKMNKIEVE